MRPPRLPAWCLAPLIAGLWSATAHGRAADAPVVLQADGATLVLEPYGPNIVRVTLSKLESEAKAGPGYGFIGAPLPGGWTAAPGPAGTVLQSDRLMVTARLGSGPARPGARPLSTHTDIARFFNGSAPGASISFALPGQKPFLSLQGWAMSVPNHKDGTAGVLADRRPSDPPFFHVAATFSAAEDEHYYGLGQNQEGALDYRGRVVRCWHDYTAGGGPSIGVPFLVTNKGYGLIWDNPSQTTVSLAFNEQTKWASEVGRRVSFFLITGATTDEIYRGYRQLTGVTPLLPKAAYGYVQCKQRYRSQAEVMAVARGYRQRHLPADVIVVDWFYYTKMGEMDFDRTLWPDPAAMNRELHAMGFQTMISVWPRFVPASRSYAEILRRGWFEHLADGTPTNGLPYDRAGSDIDTTNQAAARWYWETIRDRILSQGFDALWADETEPDLPPNGCFFSIGPGTEYYNVYPLFHTAALYDGYRRDRTQRALILARDAYLGAQRNGAFFWSSDIFPTWDTLRRQIATGLDFTASGFANWCNDTGGWQYLPATHHAAHIPLLDPSDARETVGGYDDYCELYTRWFEYAAFQPIFRTHGSRRYNEVWSYGRQAEPILEKYLRLRYELLPYIYSLARMNHESGAPFMRALFMDFPHDPAVADLRDEYMFGPAFLVAPVYAQGATHRPVYLPAGADWYNYWTGERVTGGQSIPVDAPIDRLPLFVRAGSVIPIGGPVESTAQEQPIVKVRIYPGADGEFPLYRDDGRTYAYEHGDYRLTTLRWNDAAHALGHTGPAYADHPDQEMVETR